METELQDNNTELEIKKYAVRHPTLTSRFFKNPVFRIGALALLISTAVFLSGCIDKVGDLADPAIEKTSIFIYQEGLNQEGNPEEEINEGGLYALVEAESGGDEKSGNPIATPVSRYAIQTDPETGDISIYDAKGNLIDQNDIPDNWEELIVKDNNGVPITDISKLLHIDEIGKNKYEIKGLAQEMQDPDGEHIWKVSHDMHNKYDGDTKHNDEIFKIGDGIDEMFGGFTKGEDGKVYGVILADEDVFKMYGENFGTRAGGENPVSKTKFMCTDMEKGIYLHIYDLSKIPENSVSVGSPHPKTQEMDIAIENGGFAQFRFLKEKL